MVVTRKKKNVLYRVAPIWKRLLSFIIDMLILEFFVFSKFEGLMNSMVPKIPFTTVTESTLIQISVIASIIAFFVILYFTVLEYAFGQTLGDMIIGLHLKTLIGEESGFWRVFASNLSFLPFFPLFLAFFSYTIASVLSFIFGEEAILSGNVALIPVSGTIMVGNGDGLFEDSIANSKDLIDNIKKASANPEIKAILLDINSPGGSAVASQEVAREVKRVNKTVYAFIREQGTSGAYWIASSANKIVSEELALTGSIGVISSYLDFSGLLADYNVSYQRLIAGKYKDIGTPFRKLSKEEEVMLQKRLDIIHDYFINAVADNRKLPKEKVRDLATGMFYLGIEAKEMGLVDELGDMDYVRDDKERFKS